MSCGMRLPAVITTEFRISFSGPLLISQKPILSFPQYIFIKFVSLVCKRSRVTTTKQRLSNCLRVMKFLQLKDDVTRSTPVSSCWALRAQGIAASMLHAGFLVSLAHANLCQFPITLCSKLPQQCAIPDRRDWHRLRGSKPGCAQCKSS